MEKRRFLYLAGALIAATLLAGGIALAQDPEPLHPQGASDAVGTAFTYQGRLLDGGSPADGTYDLQFALYDALSDGNQVGNMVPVEDVEVTDGYFTVELDFGDVFDGTALWLEVSVRPGDSSGAYTTLTPRQPLTAAPYARYATGAPWSGLSGIPAGFADGVDDTDDTVSWSEISPIVGTGTNQVAAGNHNHWGQTWSGTGTGLTITGTNDSGALFEVTNSGAGGGDSAVRATTGAGSGITPGSLKAGIWGDTDSGYGVRGTSNSGYGVSGRSSSGIGVYGGSSSGSGVYGESSTGYGVYAEGGAGDLRLNDGTIYANTHTGCDLELHSNDYVDVHLDDDNNSDSQFRVLNGANTAVFTVSETGAVSWAAQTGYVSIPAAAFTPRESGYNYSNYGSELVNNDNNSDYYYAPVYLPDGATVTRMIFYWEDTSSSDGSASLRRALLTTGGYNTMASVNTSGSGGDGSSETTDIDYATVDNTSYMYYVAWTLWDSNIKGHAVVIEYTYTGPH